jgi:integrase
MPDMQKMEHWLGDIPSPQTRKNYRNGIRNFEEYSGKPIEELLKLSDEELGHEVNKYYSSLRQNHPQNTCRNRTNSVIQFLKHFGKNPKYKKTLGIYTTTSTTRDHMLIVDEAREMWQIASLEEKVMLKTWLLGLRIGDACKLEWAQFNLKPSEEPQELLIFTHKEGITAHVFVDPEFQKLLQKQIPMLDKGNKYLFQSEKGGHVKEKQLLRRLQNLQKKAGVESHGKVFGWHIGRKLFLRTCAELGVTSWNAQLMCGKSVDKSIATYINGVQLKKDAMKVHEVLKMEYVNGTDDSTKIEQLENALRQVESENATFKTRVDQMQKNIQSLQESMDGLYHIAETYPRTATHHLFNKKTKKMEKWSETVNTPEEEEASLKRFEEKAKKLAESDSH